MKVSDKPTKHIAIRASVNTDYDKVSFAVVETDGYFVDMLETARSFFTPELKSVDNFYEIRFWYGIEKWTTEEYDELNKAFEDSEWCFVETTVEEISALPDTEDRIVAQTLVLDRYGSFHFVAAGKFANGEFYTGSINTEKFLEILKPVTHG